MADTVVQANVSDNSGMSIVIAEFANVQAASPIDGTPITGEDGAGGTSLSLGPTATLTQAVNLIIGSVGIRGDLVGDDESANVAWTSSVMTKAASVFASGNGRNTGGLAYLAVNSTAAFSTSPGWTKTQRSGGSIVVFKADSTPTFEQAQTGGTTGYAANVSATFTAAPADGNLVVCSVQCRPGNTTQPPTMTDSMGGAWLQAFTPFNSNSFGYHGVFYRIVSGQAAAPYVAPPPLRIVRHSGRFT